MTDAFASVNAADAQAFLRKFATAVRRKGVKLAAEGCVENLTAKGPTRFTATVNDPQLNARIEIELIYLAGDGWTGICSCDSAKENCPHVYAATSALLAEHSSAVVRSLSAGTGRQARSGQSQTGRAQIPEDLALTLQQAVGRGLHTEEDRFIKRVKAVHRRCASSKQITTWDFEEMGLSLGGYGWQGLKIWPAFPTSELDFWAYVATAARERKVAIPSFMEPVTAYERVRERLSSWQRTIEVEKWSEALEREALAEPPAPAASKVGLADLRLVFQQHYAALQIRRSGREEFEPIKATQLQRMQYEIPEGQLALTSESELLWQLIVPAFIYGGQNLRYEDSQGNAALGRVLRNGQLEQLTCTAAGVPLQRSDVVLRWNLVEAASPDEDYRLRLVRSDGAEIGDIYCVINGRPTLYLNSETVFEGPPLRNTLLNLKGETRIPAPALENASGLAFLRSLSFEAPQRIRDRIRTLPFTVRIQCRLGQVYFGSRTEEVLFEIVGEAADGHQRHWRGERWEIRKEIRPTKRKTEKEFIVYYDTSILEEAERLLAPLDLKIGSYTAKLGMRVTRQFPERFAAWIKSLPPHILLDLQGDLASFLEGDFAGQVQLDATEAGVDWFDLRVVLNVSDTTLTADEIKLLLNARGGFVRLKGRGWRRLQYNLSDEENERLARLGLNPRELTAEPQRLHALQLADEAAKRFLPAQQVQQIQRRASEIKARVTPDLPEGLQAQLRPYQQDGFHFLAYLAANRFGGILADDMGLGKTIQALAWVLWLRSEAGGRGANGTANSPDSPAMPRPGLVVCPKSVMDNWRAEADRFTPALRIKVWPASQLEKLRDSLPDADLHVLNYNQLRLLGESLTPVQWSTVILDEGQFIKNPNSQTAQVARALKADHRLILSGTPIENRLMDLWSLMAFAMPGILGSRAQFARLYDTKGDPFARRRLSARVRPFLLRRTKGQVAKDLPDRIEEDLFCEIEGEQKSLYRAELKRAQQKLLAIKTQKELAGQQFHFLTSLLRLRQICCHPRLLAPDSKESGAKLEALLEQLESLMEEGHKVLVFSQFVELLNLVRPEIASRNWKWFYLAGDTENRGDLVRDFQSTEGPAVFLISLKAGGFGLNLTAASYVVLFDPWWNPAVENQAIDRTHRIGQVNKVIAYRLLIKDSIEEKIRELQKKKKALAEDVLGEEKFAQSLTLDDLRFLLAD